MLHDAVHLLGQPADRYTLCGINKKTKNALPYMLAKHLPLYMTKARARGEIYRVCPDCYNLAAAEYVI